MISAGGTGTYDLNRVATEIQAGSYALMDTAYAKLGLPFRQALSVLATVISVSPAYAVADCGLKALGMDHGNPRLEGAKVWFCSDEHVTFAPGDGRCASATACASGPRTSIRPSPTTSACTSSTATTCVESWPSTCAAGEMPRASRTAPRKRRSALPWRRSRAQCEPSGSTKT